MERSMDSGCVWDGGVLVRQISNRPNPRSRQRPRGYG